LIFSALGGMNPLLQTETHTHTQTDRLHTCTNIVLNFSLCSLDRRPTVWIKDKVGQWAVRKVEEGDRTVS